MKQITKITSVLALLFLLASCQSSQSGCYDFGEVYSPSLNKEKDLDVPNYIFTGVECKP